METEKVFKCPFNEITPRPRTRSITIVKVLALVALLTFSLSSCSDRLCPAYNSYPRVHRHY